MKRGISRRTFLKHTILAGPALPASLSCLQAASAQETVSDDGPEPVREPWVLWYDRPAGPWVEALPVGNGRLGAMVFGGLPNERLQLNEDTLYAGGPYDSTHPDALPALPEARRLIFEGRYREAHDLIGEKMMARPIKQMPYQPAADLLLEFPGHESGEDYRRDLDLDTAIASVAYTVDDARFVREVFCSPVDQLVVVRLTADRRDRISFHASMTTPQQAHVEAKDGGVLVLRGRNGDSSGVKGALRFEVRVRVAARGGTTAADGDRIVVTGADEAMLLVAIATSYMDYQRVDGNPEERIESVFSAAAGKAYGELREAHVREHQRLFRRVGIDLGSSDAARLPTNERILQFARGEDPHLAALYFQYGRYLLISSSRPGTQPANLQGLWNESMTPPWESKYTVNINAEMNYWPAESTNLSECHEPLLRMVRELAESGRRTAEVHYGAEGWVCHHNTDLWRATAPIDGPLWGFWPTGGAWLCTHLWDHYEYSGDRAFLSEAYPVMKGAAQYFVETLVEHPEREWLVTCPSLSPENVHPHGVAICAGPTMDTQILRDLFSQCIEASTILDIDETFREECRKVRARLAPMQIGKAGQLQEWLDDWDMDAPELQHRHVSHLYGLFPSGQITPRETPDLFEAAKKTLAVRGDVGTGWSLAWKINFWARLLDGDHAYVLLEKALALVDTTNVNYRGGGGVYPNLFDAHPPFQIDGNFGATSGIAEMLMQSHAGEIHLLPALPAAWPAGRVTGLRARGGFEVDLAWRQGRLERATIRSSWGTDCRVRHRERVESVQVERGTTVVLDSSLRRMESSAG